MHPTGPHWSAARSAAWPKRSGGLRALSTDGDGAGPLVCEAHHRFHWHASQEVCPWNVKFAREVKEPSFQPRAVIAEKDARSLATELLAMSEDDFRAAFKGSAMKRAKLVGLRRNAEVVLGTHEQPAIESS